MSTTLSIICTVGALSAVCCLAILVMVLVSPGRPEHNTIGWAQRDRGKGAGSLPKAVGGDVRVKVSFDDGRLYDALANEVRSAAGHKAAQR